MSIKDKIHEEVQTGHYMANVVTKLIKNALEDLTPVALATFKEELNQSLKQLKLL